jgi:Tfp pilus assembly protein PilF
MQQAFTSDALKVSGAATPRLDGWKDIAAYLCKAERTIKRWEADRGLPIHRLPGGTRASVYAYQGELDDWLKSSDIPASDALGSGVQALDEEELVSRASTAPPDQLQNPHSARTNTRVGRIALSNGLLLAALLVASGTFILLAATLTITNRIPSIFGKSSRPADPTSSPVSVQEKNLARDLYLKGRYEWNQRTPASLNQALDSFTQAIVHDSSYAPAYAGLADTYDLLRQYSTMPDDEAYTRAINAARKAIELDDSLAEAHRALAYAEVYGTWDLADADKEFQRAIELEPKDPVVRRWYANAFAMPGRYQQSLEQLDVAQQLDPTSEATLADKGILLFYAGKQKEGIDLLNEVERINPEFRSPHAYLMLIDFDLRNFPGYLKEGKKTAEIMNDPELKDTMAAAQKGYAHGGASGLLTALYSKQSEYCAQGKLSRTALARTCTMMGKTQEALRLLEEASARHERDVLTCLSDPELITLENEPRYQALAKQLNSLLPRSPNAPATLPVSDTAPLQAANNLR